MQLTWQIVGAWLHRLLGPARLRQLQRILSLRDQAPSARADGVFVVGMLYQRLCSQASGLPIEQVDGILDILGPELIQAVEHQLDQSTPATIHLDILDNHLIRFAGKTLRLDTAEVVHPDTTRAITITTYQLIALYQRGRAFLESQHEQTSAASLPPRQ